MSHPGILILEAENAISHSIQRLLETKINVFICATTQQAMEYVSNTQIQLIFADYYLCEMEAFRIIPLLRSHGVKAAFIVVSSDATKEMVLKAFRAGASDYFDTTNSTKQLKIVLANYLNKKRTLSSPKTPGKSTKSERLKKTYFLKQLFSRLNFRFEKTEILNHHAPSTSKSTQNLLEVHFFSSFEVKIDDQLISDWPGRKARNVLAFISYYFPHPVLRDILIDQFWPDSPPAAARNCLNVTMHQIRDLFKIPLHGRSIICYYEESYSFNSTISVQKDIDRFMNNWHSAQQKENTDGLTAALPNYLRATEIYRGDFMAEDLYEKWPELDRDRFRDLYLLILNRISQFYSRDGHPEKAIELCHTILKNDICREDVHRRLMKCYLKIDQRESALRQFMKCKKILKDEFDIPPTQTTIELYENIKNQQI